MGNALHDLETRTDFESLSRLVVTASAVGTTGNGSSPCSTLKRRQAGIGRTRSRGTDGGMSAVGAVVNRHDDRTPRQDRKPACWPTRSFLQTAGDGEELRTLKGNKAHGRSEQSVAGNGGGLQRTHQLRKALKSRRSPGVVLIGSSGNRRLERCLGFWCRTRQQDNGFARCVCRCRVRSAEVHETRFGGNRGYARGRKPPSGGLRTDSRRHCPACW
jgi:hypothetical protein